MSIEISPATHYDEQTLSSFEQIGKADGVPYILGEIPNVGMRAIIEYSDIIDKIKTSLESVGSDPSKQFDATIIAWLRHHCDVLPAEGITLISKEADWDGWYDKRAPWFDKFEHIQRQYDTVRSYIDASLPHGKRPQLEMYLEDTLLWSGLPPQQLHPSPSLDGNLISP